MSNRIKELREARGMTLEQVADAAGTSFQQIQRLERGERRLTDDWMRRLAAALGCTATELLSPDLTPDAIQAPQKLEHFLLIRWWDSLDLAEKRMIAAMARDKGLEILSNNPKRRSSRRR